MQTAADVMTTGVVSVTLDTPVQEVARLLYSRRISGVPVLDADGRVIGIVSESDLMSHVGAVGEEPRQSWWLRLFSDQVELAKHYVKTHGRTARDVMMTSVITVDEDTPLTEVAKTLQKHRIKRAPVMRDGKMVGILTRSNLLQALATTDITKPVSADDREIRERLQSEIRAQPWAHWAMINVAVQDGVVSLRGFISGDAERRALRIAAENVPGVTRVEDDLAVRPSYAAE